MTDGGGSFFLARRKYYSRRRLSFFTDLLLPLRTEEKGKWKYKIKLPSVDGDAVSLALSARGKCNRVE